MILRPYQSEAVEQTLESLRDCWSTLIVLPTGAGKTVVFTEIAKRWKHGRVLILAHREELVSQAADKVTQATGDKPQIEMAEQKGGYVGTELFGESPIVVGSVQSVVRRLDRLPAEDFGLVIVDEAHHCTPQNRTYHGIVQHFKANADCRLIGVTATPDRSDKLALGQVFESVAYQMTILDAITDGWLVPIEQQFVRVNGLDFSKVRTTAGDLNEQDLDALLNADGGRMLHEIASATVDAAKDEPCLIFANSVGSAEAIAKIISRYPGKEAVCLHGKTPKEDRRYQLDKFGKGGFQFLVGCDLFLEGFDSPRISVVSNAKPTKSRSRYTQCVGRGTRLLPGCINDEMDGPGRVAAIAGSAKPRCLVLDFVGNAAQHKLISSADILAGKFAPEAVALAVKEAAKNGQPINMQTAMADAKNALEEAALRAARLADERRAKEEEQRKQREGLAWLRANPVYDTESVDPFGFSGSTGRNTSGLIVGKMATTKQKEFLAKHRIDASSMTNAEASRKIGELMENFSTDGPSPKQRAQLEKFGESPDVSYREAKVLLDIIAGRGWQKRDYPLTKDRWRIVKTVDGKFQPVVVDPKVGKIRISKTCRTEHECREFIKSVMTKEVNYEAA